MPPYTPDELYAALIANAATLENEDAANQLASGLRAFSDIVHGMAAAADAETTSPAVHRVTAVVVSRPIVTREDHRPSHSVTCRTVHGREGLTRRVACCASLPPPHAPVSSLVVSSTPFRLIVGIVTLLAGLVLCFSGTFLSLDRTRRVPQRKKPRYADIEEPEKGRWAWESTGGVGGLIGGWLAGGTSHLPASVWPILCHWGSSGTDETDCGLFRHALKLFFASDPQSDHHGLALLRQLLLRLGESSWAEPRWPQP